MMTPLDRIHAHLEGELDAGETREFAEWLLADPANRQLYVREAHIAGALRQQLQRPASAQVSARLPRSRRTRRRPAIAARWWITAAVAAAVAIAVAVLIPRSPSPEASPESVAVVWSHGAIKVQRGGVALTLPLSAVQAGDDIAVDDGAGVMLALDDGSTRLHLVGPARLSVRPAGFALGSGRLLADAAERPSDRPLRIATPHGDVTVLGTRFDLVVEGTTTRVQVAQGSVALASGAQRLEVAAGAAGIATSTGLTQVELGPVAPTPSHSSRITGVVLVDAETGVPVPGYDPMPPDAIIDLDRLGGRRLNLRAVAAAGVVPGHVLLAYDREPPVVEAAPPYELFSDYVGTDRAGPDLRSRQLSPGVHRLLAIPHEGHLEPKEAGSERPHAGVGQPGTAYELVFTVIGAAR